MKKYIIPGFAVIGKTTLEKLNKDKNIQIKLKELNWLD